MLNAEDLMRLLNKEGDWQWQALPNDFPDKMRALSGRIGQDTWLVVEHDPFEGQNMPEGEFSYDGTVVLPPSHVYHLTYDIAKAAYLKGKAFLDAQKKTNG